MGEAQSSRELANRCRQLAERCHRLAGNAYDPIIAETLKLWGDVLNAKAEELDKMIEEPSGGAD